MSNQDALDEDELFTASMDHHIIQGQALERLMQNEDFKTIILEGYFEQKALASVSLLAVPQIKQRNERPDVMEDLIAISNLKYYFNQIEMFYEGAKNPILSDQEEEELEEEMSIN